MCVWGGGDSQTKNTEGILIICKHQTFLAPFKEKRKYTERSSLLYNGGGGGGGAVKRRTRGGGGGGGVQ